jgi:hypothetical protein
MMNRQVQTLVKSIRDRLSSYNGPEDAAASLVAEWDALGMQPDAAISRNLDEAVKVVRASLEDVVILRRNSLIQDREEWYHGLYVVR